MKIIVVSGGFDPIHSGHIRYLNSASKLGDRLIVLLNSDNWLINKKSKFFLPFQERREILKNLAMVDEVLSFSDDAKGSCINGLKKVKRLYKNENIIFCNGGDRGRDTIPELSVKGISFKFGIGGKKKKNSSSELLKKWSYDFFERNWGYYTELFTDKGIKVKELVILPGKKISFQKHNYRDELWFIHKGKCVVRTSEASSEKIKQKILKEKEYIQISLGKWHQIINEFNKECRIIEIQYGDKTIEKDIERIEEY